MGNSPLTEEVRQALEATYTRRRIIELRLNPVQGNFDAAHLKEINRRIFQDLPSLGFHDVAPGVYREAVKDGGDWIKPRGLEKNPDAVLFVAYSRMDAPAIAQLEAVLAGIRLAELRQLDTAAFTKRVGQLYVELDYVHPFSDGNSRTLREFTRQLAEACGYTLNWERFGSAASGRDALYLARDRSVNTLALPHIHNVGTKRDLLFTLDQIAQCRDLPDLLRDAISPLVDRDRTNVQPGCGKEKPQTKGQVR